MLRLASSTVVSNALRAIAFPRILSGSINNAFSDSQNSIVKKESLLISHHFSTDSKKLLDRIFDRVLKSAIKSDQLFLEKSIPPIPADFPFKIQDNPHQKTISLTRKLAGEKIYVSVAMPQFIPDDDDEKSLVCHKCGRAAPVNLYVKITKQNGKILDFEVYVSADEMNVSQMSVVESASESENRKLVRFGPHSVDNVDAELQSALTEYLEIRGIRKSDALFLYKYMIRKSRRDPLQVLEKLKKFIEEE